MKPARFDYAAPSSIDALLSLLTEYGSAATVLAGGQSLLPLLNRRRVRPELLVDLNRVAGLGGISFEQDSLRIGAMTCQREIEYSRIVAEHAPLLAKAIKFVGNPATRNRGTLGGSIAFAEPSAELPACMVCLDASFRLASERGERRIAAVDFFRGRHLTVLAADEVLLSIEIASGAGQSVEFLEISRRAQDQAIVGVAARITKTNDATATIFGVDERPIQIGGHVLDGDWPITLAVSDEIAAGEDRRRLARAGIARIPGDRDMKLSPYEREPTAEVNAVINRQHTTRRVSLRQSLADFLRSDLGYTGVHVGCEQGVCGACTVVMNGAVTRSCLVLAVQADGAIIETIEDATLTGRVRHLQDAFFEHGAVQCGFCTAGMILTAADLLAHEPAPSRERIRTHLAGNYCRCTGYESIVDAVDAAAKSGALTA
jgi:aerobic-type carbon monoxide dehydrogenase small subunit (CoxS/CutS family)/CO/xanthine dehydrogenase FAD-binding subunit